MKMQNISVVNKQKTDDVIQLLENNNYVCFTFILDVGEIISNELLVNMIKETSYQNHQVIINEIHEYKKQVIIFENKSTIGFIDKLKKSKIKDFCNMYNATIISEKYITNKKELSEFN